jgi:integrase
MPLTDTKARNAKAKNKPYRIADSGGLYLEVTPTGSRYWRWKYRFDGKEKRLALGVYPDVTLAAARIKRDAQRKILKEQGNDPLQARREGKITAKIRSGNTFEAIARQWWDHWKSVRSLRHADYVLRRLEVDVFADLGGRPIAEITAPQLLAVIRIIEKRGALDIAKRALQTCGQIFRYAVAHGICERNPVADIKPQDALKPRKKQNHVRLPATEFPELLRKIESYDGALTTRFALRLMALTFVRTSELIGARWNEFDLTAAEWRIPAERMKMKTPHIVPLATQAVETLERLLSITGNNELLFPGERDHQKPMSNNTILYALYRMGYHSRMTGHGFRGLASTILHESGFRHDYIELQLAHQERDETSAAYNHALYLKERRKMMQAWADMLDVMMADAGNVISMRGNAA